VNKNYISGRRFEYKRRDAWVEKGYTVARTAGSKGPFDLLCFRSDYPSVFIQCKRTEKRSTAEKLIESFRTNPPLTPSKYFKQVMEVWVKGETELLSVTV
jgi:hypothetical protein